MVEKDRVGGRGRVGRGGQEREKGERTWKVVIRRGAPNNHTHTHTKTWKQGESEIKCGNLCQLVVVMQLPVTQA